MDKRLAGIIVVAEKAICLGVGDCWLKRRTRFRSMFKCSKDIKVAMNEGTLEEIIYGGK